MKKSIIHGCVFYFSGTGNTAFIAKAFCQEMDQNGHDFSAVSIESKRDIPGLIEKYQVLAFAFPVYGSAPPRNMREFIARYLPLFQDKKVIIFSTQALFSGDGARSLMDCFGDTSVSVLGAEHFMMPNNICNFALTPVPSRAFAQKLAHAALKKMRRFCQLLLEDQAPLRGFHPLSEWIGYWSQRSFFVKKEGESKKKVFIDQQTCVSCGRCVKACPVDNLLFADEGLTHRKNCISCYRCVNLCPEKAIRVLLDYPVRRQYSGL